MTKLQLCSSRRVFCFGFLRKKSHLKSDQQTTVSKLNHGYQNSVFLEQLCVLTTYCVRILGILRKTENILQCVCTGVVWYGDKFFDL